MTEDNDDDVDTIRGLGERIKSNFPAQVSYKQLDEEVTRARIDLNQNPNPNEMADEVREFLSGFEEVHYIPGQDGVLLARLD